MAQSLGNKLDSGDAFPDLELQLVGGGTQTISQIAAGQWCVLLLYRGDW
jgi:peroxiredoxin